MATAKAAETQQTTTGDVVPLTVVTPKMLPIHVVWSTF